MNNRLKIQDIITIALLAALFIALYYLTMAISMPLGAMGHAISPGIQFLIAGPVVFYIAHKVGKMWQFTLFSAIIMLVFSIMGAGYLPWIITTMVAALIADLMVSKSNNPSNVSLACASGILAVGQAWGAIVPSWFFVESYRSEWISRGVSPDEMDAMISSTQGMMGVLSTVLCFVLAFIGIYLGYLVLRKHFKLTN